MLYFSKSCKSSTLSDTDEHGCQTWKLYYDVPDGWRNIKSLNINNLHFSAKATDHIDEVLISSNLITSPPSV